MKAADSLCREIGVFQGRLTLFPFKKMLLVGSITDIFAIKTTVSKTKLCLPTIPSRLKIGQSNLEQRESTEKLGRKAIQWWRLFSQRTDVFAFHSVFSAYLLAHYPQ